jgi:hypothetical protein
MQPEGHSLDPVRQALQDFEAAVVARERRSLVEGKVMRQQTADRARERVMEEILELVRRTLAERERRDGV